MNSHVEFVHEGSPQLKRLWRLANSGHGAAMLVQTAVRVEGIQADRLLDAALHVVSDGLGYPGSSWKGTAASAILPDVIDQDELHSVLQRERDDYSFDIHDLQVRLLVLSGAEGQCYLALTVPALLADLRSLQVMNSQIHERCCSVTTKREAPIRYDEVTRWQQAIAEGGGAAEREYWHRVTRELSESGSAEARLPLDNRPESVVFAPESHSYVVTKELSEQIKRMASVSGCQARAVLAAAWQTVIWRLSNNRCGGIGYVLDGRADELLQSVIGPLSKSVPARIRADHEIAFDQLMKGIQLDFNEMEASQDFFAWEQEAETSYFPYLFEYLEQESPYERSNEAMLLVSEFACPEPFHLKLSCRETSKGFQLLLYRDAYIEPAYTESILRSLLTLLSDASEHSGRMVGQLELLDSTSRRQLVIEFNETACDIPTATASQLFEEQAAHNPEKCAVQGNGHSWSYRELNEKANCIAHALLKRGVGPEVPVGIMLERTPELLAGVLGIMKAGGAYLPLDPQYPQERIEFMLKDSGCALVLAQSGLEEQLPQGTSLLLLDSDMKQWSEESTANPQQPIQADQLAYIIYTSGSTGTPKGVMIEHRGLANYLNWCQKQYAGHRQGGAPVHSSLAFDLTVTSLFTPLITGETVYLIKETEGPAISEALASLSGLGLAKITPAHLQLLSKSLSPQQLADWAAVIVVGGEQVYGESLQAWRQYSPDTLFINEYGPTETVVGCATYSIAAGRCSKGAIPIGRPIDNTQLYVLDERQEPVAIGVTGELYIGGAGVARGYINRPELNEERFVLQPIEGVQTRLYRTGDLVRFRADGNLEFIGRVDNQVKVRGYRIELGDVESAILRHPAVRDCAVIVKDHGHGASQLSAFCVLEADMPLEQDELRSFMRDIIPEYMVPAEYGFLSSLPLTINGKVDRKQLLHMKGEQRPEQQEPLNSTTATEKMLIAVWQEVIGDVSITTNHRFYDVGGDSILAIQCISRIQSMLNVEFPVRAFFDYPTIKEFASYLDDLLKQQILEELGGLSDEEVSEMLRRENSE
ncbi:non-ribosomal peptide synthetase [Paenibacillus sp. SYP-B4298]|uniref:non-ribosomal peptide synthetase n=1 Tax=Paenibacillus sp. SYP-B4298 TaxID=2996034 RepID=UPI0022DD53D1|nr:amino acid adenylation domain-containing protein [Paenibacillus sp. SYP-B4298]